MPSRLDLQAVLEEILGSTNVYFQPPASVRMQYPAIVYKLSRVDKQFANDETYLQHPGYEITLIDRNPDSEFFGKILRLPYCKFDRYYPAENLNHWVFTKRN